MRLSTLAATVLALSPTLAQEQPQAPPELPWLKPGAFKVEETVRIEDWTLVVEHEIRVTEAEGALQLTIAGTVPIRLNDETRDQLMRQGRSGGQRLGRPMGRAPMIFPSVTLGPGGALRGMGAYDEAVDRFGDCMVDGMFDRSKLTDAERAELEALEPKLHASITQGLQDGPPAEVIATMARWKMRAIWQAWGELWGHLPAAGAREVELTDRWRDRELTCRATVSRVPEGDGLAVKAAVVCDDPAAAAAHGGMLRAMVQAQGGNPDAVPAVDVLVRRHTVTAQLDPTTRRPQTVELELELEMGMNGKTERERDRRSYRFTYPD